MVDHVILSANLIVGSRGGQEIDFVTSLRSNSHLEHMKHANIYASVKEVSVVKFKVLFFCLFVRLRPFLFPCSEESCDEHANILTDHRWVPSFFSSFLSRVFKCVVCGYDCRYLTWPTFKMSRRQVTEVIRAQAWLWLCCLNEASQSKVSMCLY